MDITFLTPYLVFVFMTSCWGTRGQLIISSDACGKVGYAFRIQVMTDTPPAIIQWRRSDKHVRIISNPLGQNCRVEPTTAYNLTEYTLTCDINNYSMAIKSVSGDDLYLSWTITVIHFPGGTSYMSTPQEVRLCVPVNVVTMKQPTVDRIDVKEGSSETFLCETSAAWPQATITWIKQNMDRQEETITGNITTNYDESGNLTISNSSLKYSPPRQDQNYRILCKANNTDGQSVLSTRRPQLNILFAPDDQPLIQGYGDLYTVVENATANITCVIHGGNPAPVLTWTCNNNGVVTDESVGTETKSTLVWTPIRGQDGPCTCVSYHPLLPTNQFDSVTVEILYPPTKPAIAIDGVNRTGTVKVISTTVVPLTCYSSGKPPPKYTWRYLGNQQNKNQISEQINMNSSAKCTATNTMTADTGTLSQTSVISFHILYGPTEARLFCLRHGSPFPLNGNTVDVIDGGDLTLVCSAESDPEPVYTWNDGQQGDTITVPNIREDGLSYNCTSRTLMQPDYGSAQTSQVSGIVHVNRFSEPTQPTLTYIYSGGVTGILTAQFNVVENSSFSTVCNNSYGKPPPRYRWIGQTGHDTLFVNTIKRSPVLDANGTSFYDYICSVENMMTNTCGDGRTQTGTHNRTQRVNVLYPAFLNPLPNRSISEGEELMLSATVGLHGSPRETYAWYHHQTYYSSRQKLADSLEHSLGTVSKRMAGFYTIEAKNQINPTGLPSGTERVEQTFFLNVFYKSMVSNFTVNGLNGDTTINETDSVSFMCMVDGNPRSNIELHADNYNGHSPIATMPLTDRLEHTLQKASCNDTGKYSCVGQNNYTSTPAVMEARVFVTCTPRPLYPVEQNVTSYSDVNKTVILTLTIIAYPIPPPDRFKWEKITPGDKVVVTNNPNTEVTTVGAHTNLTIKRLQQSDLGQYQLSIQYEETEDSYIYIHYFNVAPQDKPEVPTHFTHVEESLTDTTSQFEWIPGFDGGLQQTFCVLYKLSTDSNWSYMCVSDSNITLTNLIPNTLYFVKMFASNEKGNSSETRTLTFTTNQRIEVTSSFPSAVVGGVVGGIFGFVLVTAFVVVIVLQRRKIKRLSESVGKKEHGGTETSTIREQTEAIDHEYHTIDIGEQDDPAYYNLDRNPYEDLQTDKRSAHEYGSLNLTEMQSPSGGKTYENLRLSPMK